MRLLITGGAGFVGANLIAKLQEGSSYAIRVLDNESLGRRRHLSEFSGIEFLKGDIRDDGSLRQALAGCDAVVHLAADTRVMDSIADPSLNFAVNVEGSFKLLKQARDLGVERIINASTGGAIMGDVEPPVHEGMVPQPISPYGASKLASEGYMSAFAGSYGLRTLSLRFSNIYGPRSYHKGSVVAAFFKEILAGRPLMVYGDGSQQRDFLYADDLAAGIEAAIHSDLTGVYQLGSGRPTSVASLIGTMRRVIGTDFEIAVAHEDFRQGEIHSTWCDISRAREDLGFSPATSLEQGIRASWAWFLAAHRDGRLPARSAAT